MPETNEQNEIERLEGELRTLKSKNRWAGKGGIWSTFRNLGKSFYNDKEKSTEDKRAALKADIESFVAERLN